MDDVWEDNYFGSLSQGASGDFDSDGITNLEEYTYGLNPTVNDAYDDADFDRYPNVFEIRAGSDPTSAGSVPTPTYTVNGAGGGSHTTIASALGDANVSNGNFQIISIAPGTYKGNSNLRGVWTTSSKPKILFIGASAANTIIDGELANYGWVHQQSAVVASLTFKNAGVAHYIDASSIQVRFVDVIVRDNVGLSTYGAAIHINNAGQVHIVGSTFLDNNTGGGNAEQIWVGAGAATITNTAVGGSGSAPTMLGAWGGATLTTNYSWVKGQTLSGTGNLAGSTNPKILANGHLQWDSPLRGAGGAVTQSRIDLDGEARPSSSPDIGVDQFLDADSDNLSDTWELGYAGTLTTLTSRSQDADGDGLTNAQEEAAFTNPTVADTDGDALIDGDELTAGTNPLVADSDGDTMPDGYEVSHGLAPLVNDALTDLDGDRFPNIFEYFGGSDPNDRASTPTPTYTVNPAGGGTHTSIGAAVADANVSNGPWQIIAVAPGVYTGDANLRNVTIGASKPKLLIIGLEGAGKTIIDGQLARYGWLIQQTAVIASMTFRRAVVAHYVDAATADVRFVDLIVRDNIGSSWAAGVHVNAAAKVFIANSTFLNNAGYATYAEQIWMGNIGAGVATIVNTVVGGTTSGTRLVEKAGGAILTTNHCLVKNQTLTGTGNLAGNVDPKLRSDGRLRSDSPLRAAGGATSQSRIDLDGELRPTSAPDIGADQWKDSDSDGLPDYFEVANTGNLTTITGSGDADSDGLTNLQEYDLETNYADPDTDKDLLKDGEEVARGKNPLVADADDLFSDVNGDGVIDSIGVQLGHQPSATDSDGDGVSNADELLMCTSPVRADTDGDGVNDGADKFPHDPLMSSFPSNPSDTTPPVITLSSPWYAVEQ